jgi:hypothetical protein
MAVIISNPLDPVAFLDLIHNLIDAVLSQLGDLTTTALAVPVLKEGGRYQQGAERNQCHDQSVND